MASTRRIGSEKSATREEIVQAARLVLQHEGAAGLTASNVAKKAGLKAHMVHYYFRSMEDLVLALVRQHGEVGLKNAARAIASDEPLRALWDVEIGHKWSVIAMEIGALAYHHEKVRDEMARSINDMRSLQAEGITRHCEIKGIALPMPAVVLTIVLSSIARQLVREKEFNVSQGHEEMAAAVDSFLRSLAAAPGLDSI